MVIVTADLYDQHHGSVAVCERQFRSFGQRRAFFGPCSTLKTFEDHTPVLAALSEAGNGRVLVIDGEGSRRVGLMGDRLAAIGTGNGWAGLIINGAIRDSLGIDSIAIGVKALGTTARRGWIPGTSERDVPLQIGGVTFSSGDWIYADVDCVLVSPHELDLNVASAPLTTPEPHA